MLKKWLIRWIKKMYVKYGEPDLVALTRLQTANVKKEVNVFDLGKTECKAVAIEAKTVLNSEAFKIAYNNVTARLLFHIQTEAQDLNAIMYDRYSINGVALIREELESLAENISSQNEDFDKFSIL
jgi:hypothetical protein